MKYEFKWQVNKSENINYPLQADFGHQVTSSTFTMSAIFCYWNGNILLLLSHYEYLSSVLGIREL